MGATRPNFSVRFPDTCRTTFIFCVRPQHPPVRRDDVTTVNRQTQVLLGFRDYLIKTLTGSSRILMKVSFARSEEAQREKQQRMGGFNHEMKCFNTTSDCWRYDMNLVCQDSGKCACRAGYKWNKYRLECRLFIVRAICTTHQSPD